MWLQVFRSLFQRDGQTLHAAQDQGIVPLRLSPAKPDLRQALSEPGDGDFGLEPGERRAQAEMNAMAERDVRVLRPADVEALGIVEGLGVAVGRVHEGEDPLALADGLA